MDTRSWRWIGLLALTLAIVALGARSQAAGTATTLSEKDAGRYVQLKLGDTLIIELQGNPSTGFAWEVDSVDAAVLEQQGDPQFEVDQPGLAGSGGTLTFQFEAAGRGETRLQLVYHRPWERDTPPASAFEVMVVVQ